MVAPTPSGYSTCVHIELLAGSERFLPAQIGGSLILFDREVVLPGTDGELILSIDDRDRRWRVRWDASDAPRRRVHAEFREVEYMAASGGATGRKRAAD